MTKRAGSGEPRARGADKSVSAKRPSFRRIDEIIKLAGIPAEEAKLAKLKFQQALEAEIRGRLERVLREAIRHYDQPNPRSVRQGALVAINVLIEHLEVLGVDHSLTRPIEDISEAFHDAERGVPHPLFAPSPLDHRRPLSIRRLKAMKSAALAMDMLMLAGMSKKFAAGRVAGELERRGIPLGGKWGVPDWKKVAGWRDRLSAAAKRRGRASIDWHLVGFFYLLRRGSLARQVQEDGKNPKDLAMSLLADIRQAIPPSD